MTRFFMAMDDFVQGRGVFAADAPLRGRLPWLVILLLVCGMFYGAVMGTYTGLTPDRWHQMIYSGLKVPLLLLVTFLLCLPSFFVLNTIAGLRDDFPAVLRAVLATQSCITVVLACLAPITAFFYLSIDNYRVAVLFNGLMFAFASGGAQAMVRRYYSPLVARDPRHRPLRAAWFLLYIFVGIQMAWVLRPFIGRPELPVRFFREDAWGNAYVEVANLFVEAFLQ